MILESEIAMKSLFSILVALPMIVIASEKADQFKALEKNTDAKAAIAVLLKPYGKMEEFRIFDESNVSEECTDKTVIRANVRCNKKEMVKDHLYFAEGNGLLCKISDKFQSIRCLPK